MNDVRLSQAAILLETTNYSVAAISREAGFEDAFYFPAYFGQSTAFHRQGTAINYIREQGNTTHS